MILFLLFFSISRLEGISADIRRQEQIIHRTTINGTEQLDMLRLAGRIRSKRKSYLYTKYPMNMMNISHVA